LRVVCGELESRQMPADCFGGRGMRMEKPVDELRRIAAQIRIDIIKSLAQARSGHSGGSLSSVEILTALYFHQMNVFPDDPANDERDYFVLSKGHVCPALYAVLARAGYFPVEELLSLRQLGSRLQGHPCRSKGLPGLEVSTGSLGQGLSIGVGAALGLRHDRKPNHVYVLNGDGELDEGNIWEAIMSAGHYGLDNLTSIVDNNNLQIDGFLPDVMNLYPLKEKYLAFNWHVVECDGHDVADVLRALKEADANKGKPTVVIAKTTKGKGVSFMENEAGWHGKPPSPEQAIQALRELYEQRREVGGWEGADVELTPPIIAEELQKLDAEFAE